MCVCACLIKKDGRSSAAEVGKRVAEGKGDKHFTCMDGLLRIR